MIRCLQAKKVRGNEALGKILKEVTSQDVAVELQFLKDVLL